MTATITYPDGEISRGLYVVAVSRGLCVTATITYPDSDISRGLYVVATATDLLLVFVQRLALTLMVSRFSEGSM